MMNNYLVSCIASLGAALAIGLLTHLDASLAEFAMVMAPFGATTALIFGLPNSPLAQPKNVILRHLITAFIDVFFTQYIGVNPMTLAIATGLGVTMMLMTKTTHHPAGANPMLIMLSAQNWAFLVTSVLTGAILIVLIGKAFHLLQNRLTKQPS